MPATTREQVDALLRVTQAQAEALVWRHRPLAAHAVHPIVADGALFDWWHGFALARVDVPAGGRFQCGGGPRGQQVRFVHRGTMTIDTADGPMTLGQGDTITLPDGCSRDFTSDNGAVVFAVWAA
jgi:hypothetical protein